MELNLEGIEAYGKVCTPFTFQRALPALASGGSKVVLQDVFKMNFLHLALADSILCIEVLGSHCSWVIFCAVLVRATGPASTAKLQEQCTQFICPFLKHAVRICGYI